MIDMRMREHDRIDLFDGDWKPQVLRLTFTAFSLKQTAVEKYGLTCHPQDVTRTGDLPRCTDEFDFHNSLEKR